MPISFVVGSKEQEYFNRTFDDLVNIMVKLGLGVEGFSVDWSKGYIEFNLHGLFVDIPVDANNFANLMRKAILKEGLASDKATN